MGYFHGNVYSHQDLNSSHARLMCLYAGVLLLADWHTQTSFTIMSNKGRLPASGLGADWQKLNRSYVTVKLWLRLKIYMPACFLSNQRQLRACHVCLEHILIFQVYIAAAMARVLLQLTHL